MLESRPKAYEDKVMDGSPLPELGLGDASAEPMPEGVRSFVSETRVGLAHSDNGLQLRKSLELGQRIEYRRETLNHGDFFLRLDGRASRGDAGLGTGSTGFATERASERITLQNRGFPITERLFADTMVGDLASEVTEALARAYRITLGTSSVRGAGTRIYGDGFEFRAGTGVRGVLAGGPYPGFERTQGALSWVGYSQRVGAGYAGLQVNHATEVPSFTLTGTGLGLSDVTGVAASLGYGGELTAEGSHRGRAMLIHSSASGAIDATAQGVFLEGSARWMGMRHEFGAYRADPGLRYGDYLLASDNRGAYWRVDSGGMRWNWGLGLDVEEQNPGRETDRSARRNIGVGANAQYRFDRDNAVAGTVNISRSREQGTAADLASTGYGSRSYYASGYYQTRLAHWGRSRLRATLRRNELVVLNGVPATGEEVEWEQDWITGRYETMRPEFTTTLGFARDRSGGVAETSPTAGVAFRLWPDADWSVGGTLRYTARDSNLATSRGLSGTLDTEKVLGNGWTAGASLSLNQAVLEIPVAGIAAQQVSRSNDRFGTVYLRWEDSSGGPFRGAGVGTAGAVGAGSVGGIVFFDANRDGEQQLGEGGVPNVQVVMDGRYRVTTDRNGRFDFPLVGTGRHQLTLTLDTVPLPWGAASERAVSIEVPLRGQADARIPVVRVGD